MRFCFIFKLLIALSGDKDRKMGFKPLIIENSKTAKFLVAEKIRYFLIHFPPHQICAPPTLQTLFLDFPYMCAVLLQRP